MSNLVQHRAMHDEGPYVAVIHTGNNRGSHADHMQASVMDNYVPCPYEGKVITNGTAARMVLMFLRELLDHLSAGGLAQESYRCPISKCRSTFPAPIQLIQHLLSCPLLLSGEFDCDKCNSWHSYPTNEKDWAQWVGWKSQPPAHGSHIQRKRSLGSKMRDFAILRRKESSRKQNPALDRQSKDHSYFSNSRPSTAVSETPSTTYTARDVDHIMAFPGQGRTLNFPDVDKPMLPHGLPEVSGGMFWPGFHASQLCDLPSTVSSIAPSSTLVEDDSPKALTENNSQTTLFNPALSPYQPSTTSTQETTGSLAPAQQYLFPSQRPYDQGPISLPGPQPAPSAMSLDEPLPVTGSALSPVELRPTPSGGEHSWWGSKMGVETPRQAPSSPAHETNFNLQASMAGILSKGLGSGVSSPTSPCRDASPFYRIQPSSGHSMSRALSHDSMQVGTTAYGTPVPDGNRLDALSPHANHNHHSLDVHHKTGLESAEDLRCDECNWKPRGVRENLKGYLRKHKNTHKGLRLACDVPDCSKTFSRLDNLKKHKKDKHGIEDGSSITPGKKVDNDYAENMEEEVEQRRPSTVESELRGLTESYPMLWPALHF